MPELTSPTSGSTDQSPTQPDGSTEVDPFEKLYKMSTTAGLGSGDYVAVSPMAVAAVLLGILSGLVLFRSPILLLIPLIGAICSVIAFIQIAHSNGTQTGREAAAVGLLLSLGLGGYVGFLLISVYSRNTADQKSIAVLVQKFGEDIRAGDGQKMTDAYGMCDAAFTNRFAPQTFNTRWDQVRHSPMFGDLLGMETTGIINFDDDQVSGDRLGDGMIKLNFTNTGPNPARIRMAFRYVGETWKIDQVDLFVDEKKPTAPAAAPVPAKPVGPFGPSLAVPTTAESIAPAH